MTKNLAESTTKPKQEITYSLGRIGNHGEGYNPFYVATVEGVKFGIGYFATVEEAIAAAEANMADYLTRLDPRPVYRVEELGTVTVDTGTIMILDPCRIGRLAATQKDGNLVDSPLYPDDSLKPNRRMDEAVLARQILDPEVPRKENPKKHEDFGTTAGNALSLRTGLGDGEYSVTAEIVDCGEPLGERIAAIHIQFMATEDINVKKLWKKSAKKNSEAAAEKATA